MPKFYMNNKNFTDKSHEDSFKRNNKRYNKMEMKPGVNFFETLSKLTKPISLYKLQVFQTYVLEEQKLLVLDGEGRYLSRVEVMPRSKFCRKLEMEAYDIERKSRENLQLLNEPAYIFYRASTRTEGDYRIHAVNIFLYLYIGGSSLEEIDG